MRLSALLELHFFVQQSTIEGSHTLKTTNTAFVSKKNVARYVIAATHSENWHS
jgi:hypothetical protein